VTGGLVPGSVPPFAWPYLPGVRSIYFDESVCEYKKIGFNAATLDKSVVMKSSDYVELINGYFKLDC
jgi:prolyl-tRNA editing enzyme YbaK/EbsC (Cys-tRNA(Pro) deacylase)